ncbi:DUF58 domain-containing protein [Roseiflexus castenholzii]|uniref:DUF58 domain-containing protein n=1 Tax=Roseiflexus castenholzii (strain DSM 13941 / HLO8) TaxID=383372 RepID=A7NN41_ROSCS|nr:DUF58 domain-containing protein [Roseiflexus castenholzii]ABU58973.1 protein of unknown function DUF58 [Roseiflexus castenholzii DSM 13941]
MTALFDNRALIGLSALAFGLALLGLATLNGALIMLAVPPAIFVGAALLDTPTNLQLRATRTLSAERALPGVMIDVHVAVTNHGLYPTPVLIADVLPAGLELTGGQPVCLTLLAPGATVTLAYTVRGMRGFYHFNGVQATVSDCLGLGRRTVAVAAPGKILIMPEVVRLTRLGIRPRRTRIFSGTIPARQGGAGVEFFGVREYQAGDPVRWINNRATARFPGSLYVNEFEQERVADIGIILDARRGSDVQGTNHTLFEYSVQAVAALSDALISQGNRVGLLIYGHAIEWTFPGYGRIQREKVLRALAQARTGDRAALASLADIPTRLFPARSQIVLVSPLQPGDAPPILHMRAHGYEVLIVSPDPVAFEAKTLGSVADLAARIARVERQALLQRLLLAGVRIVDWDVETPLAQALAHFQR